MDKPAVFFDRDGTIIREVGYLDTPAKLAVLPNATEAIKRVRSAGYFAVVVSNQSGVAWGYFTEETVKVINQTLLQRLSSCGTTLDGIYYCPHHPDGAKPEYRKTCTCRKPSPGLIMQARDALGIDIGRSIVIGDKQIDVELARQAGCRGVLVLTGYGVEERETMVRSGRVRPDYIAEDTLDAVQWLLGNETEV